MCTLSPLPTKHPHPPLPQPPSSLPPPHPPPLDPLPPLHPQSPNLWTWIAPIQCRQDNNSHMKPAYSAQFRGLESAIKVSPNTTFFYPIKLENYTRRIKYGFSEVLRTSPYPSHKIQLILTNLTVVSLFPYLFWGTRNGSCRFSVYMLFLGIPWSYPDVLYIAGKIFSREIQRS